MLELHEFTIRDTLLEEDGIVVLRAEDNRDHRPVLLRALSSARPAQRDISRLQHDCDVARSLNLPATLRATECIVGEAHPVLVMEDFGGMPLERLLDGPMQLEAFFHIALQLADAVAQLHSHGIIHRELRPANVFVHPSTGELKISNFASSTRIPWQQVDASDLVLQAGMLPYMAPEQTGRMNRAIDFRTDLYALGVMFYRMLAGHLPFEARDPMEWVHCHIARAPVSLRDGSSVPEALSEIVDKLLAKMADSRYQTAAGLRADLETCWLQLSRSGGITTFALGTVDISPRLIVPQTLYGREREVAALVEAFERVMASETSALVLVLGYSGLGKSSLVQELYRPIIRQRCYFITGKFDQYKADVPYALIGQVFRGLIRQLLAESEPRVAAWREELRGALGVNAQLIVDIVPELALLIGPQPPVPALDLAVAQRRFFMVFEQFVGVFARPERPLVLFLDDLQWADAATLELLEHLLTTARLRGFLLVGAYRDNEVGPAHPLTQLVESVERAGHLPGKLELAPLSPELVDQMMRDTLRGHADVGPLAALLYHKTLGNPFFLIQLLRTLADEDLIWFDARKAMWRWDLARIEGQGYSENVADLMSRRLARLSLEARRILQLAAALGIRGNVRVLAMTAGLDETVIEHLLEEAAREGLLLLQGESYAFLHDRVRQAAYSLLPELERPAVHVRIGRRLMAELPPPMLEAQVFDVVDQLDHGLELVTEPAERIAIARLELIAGQRAKASGAFAAAVRYLDAGLALLPVDAWDAHYELAFALHLDAAESKYLAGRVTEAELQLAGVIDHARTPRDAARAIEVNVDLLTAQGRIEAAVDAALAGLVPLGIHLPRHPTFSEVDAAYRAMWELLGTRPVESLASLPAMSDPDREAAYRLMTCVHASSYFFDLNLCALLASHEVALCLRHGNPDGAAFAYAELAFALVARFGHYEQAARFVTLSAAVAEQTREPRLKLRAWMPLWGLASIWVRPFRESVEGLRRSFRLGVQLGDLTYACYAGVFIAAVRFTLGDPLDEVARDLRHALEYARGVKFDMMGMAALTHQQLLRCLRGESARFGSLDDPGFDESSVEQTVRSNPYLAAWYFVSKLEARCWAGDTTGGWSAAETASGLVEAMKAMPLEAEYRHARSLVLVDRFETLATEERAAALASLRDYRADLGALARLCPENWRTRHALVSAEIARLTGDALTAQAAYEEAMQAARDSGQLPQQALACERAARFYRERGFELIAETYLRNAHAGYKRWGAGGKVRQLEARYPLLAQRAASSRSGATGLDALDAISIAKASRAISGSLVLADLQNVLLRLSMENAGARRAALLLVQDGRWNVAAELDVERPDQVLPPRPLAEVSTVCQPMISLVRHTREPVVIDDAARDSLFAGSIAGDAGRVPRSMLCMPILRQDQLVGVLYLENDLIAGAFSSAKLAIIEQLAAQAAISLENARLYQDLRREIADRTAAQTALQANQNLLQAIIDTSTAAIFVKDLEGRHLLVNTEFETVMGVPRSALLGKTDRDLFPAEQAERFRETDAQVLRSGQAAQEDEVLTTAHGLRTFLSLKFPLLDPDGRPYAICGIATDISDRKRMERALEDAIKTRDNFMRIASHELRTPLTPLQLQLELVADLLRNRPDISREVLANKLGLPLRQVGRLRALVVEMLDVARLQSGRLELCKATVDLCDVCRDVAEDLQLELARSGTELGVDCMAPVIGEWDRSRLEQVVTNLLTNAMKFGGHRPVQLAVRAHDEHAVVTVTDHGIGIAPGDQKRIFAPFERAVSTNYAGLGMGLYIASEIVIAHGGAITVDSEVGRGSTFTVSLPLTYGEQ
jgi:PAS domain S-box-containing protein